MNALDVTDVMYIAKVAHTGQFRRWPKEPYSFHLARVAGVTAAYGVSVAPYRGDAHKLAIQTAWLHDIVEDCADWSIAKAFKTFGEIVGEGVQLLTKEPGMSFEDYLARLADGPCWVRQIKLIDRADNLAGPFPLWEKKGFEFIDKYIPETRSLLQALKGTDPVLEQIVHDKLSIIDIAFDRAFEAHYPEKS